MMKKNAIHTYIEFQVANSIGIPGTNIDLLSLSDGIKDGIADWLKGRRRK